MLIQWKVVSRRQNGKLTVAYKTHIIEGMREFAWEEPVALVLGWS